MPIECDVEVSPVGQERFHTLDKVIMRHAFDMHNGLGRFFDERIYQDELAHLCRAFGMEALREVEIRVIHKDFSKPYYIDLLIDRGLIYELKTSQALSLSHQKQLLHYLLLADLNHGKLINLRPSSVESRFVSTSLTRIDRTNFQMDARCWQGDDQGSQLLMSTLRSLLEDWGAFLELNLYREALQHFLGGQDTCVQPVNIEVNGRVVGTQKMSLLNSDNAWHLSAARIHLQSYEKHLVRLIQHTRLKSIHWINLDQRHITIKTLKK